MTLRSLLPLFASLALASCTINGGDGDDDDGDDVADSGDDGGDPSGDSGDSDDSDDPGDSGDDSDDDASSDGDDPGDDSDDSSDGPDVVDPRSGAWEYSEYTPVSNDCDIPVEYGNGGGGFGLVSNGDGSFTVFPNDDTAAFDCELEGADFVCPDRATERAEIAPYDAVLVGQASAEGTFSDDENASGSQTAVIECEGADCSLLEQVTGAEFPCNFEVDFVIDWRTDA